MIDYKVSKALNYSTLVCNELIALGSEDHEISRRVLGRIYLTARELNSMLTILLLSGRDLDLDHHIEEDILFTSEFKSKKNPLADRSNTETSS
jgi:hypothetical protein